MPVCVCSAYQRHGVGKFWGMALEERFTELDVNVTTFFARRTRRSHLLSTTALVLAGLGLCMVNPRAASAADATWLANPATSTFGDAANWNTGVVPNGVATFGASANTNISIFADTTVSALNFAAGAPNYTITLAGSASGVEFLSSTGGITGNSSALTLNNNNTSGNSIIRFTNGATANNSTINNTQGQLIFDTGASAGSATINNVSSMRVEAGASLGSANVTNQGTFRIFGNGGNANISGNGVLQIFGSANLQNATVNPGEMSIYDTATAGNATINLRASSQLDLRSRSNASNAKLVFSGGTLRLQFHNDSVIPLASFSGSSGLISIGNKTLITGGDNLSTDFGGGITNGPGTTVVSKFEKVGTGTLTLSGTNNYNGGTTITGGGIQLGNGGTAGSVTGAIVNNGALSVNRSDSYTMTSTNLISGTGSFTQLGTGTTTFVADNTYTGGTTITSGRLQVGNGGTTGSFIGDVANSGIFAINRSDNINYTNAITGTGAFEQNGTGTTTFSTNQTFTGTSTINSGTLQLGNGGTTGSVVGAIVTNANLAINRSDTVTLPGVISGNGNVRQIGTGTTILTGNNTYTGTTFITNGALQIGDGGATGAVIGNIVNSTALSVNRTGSVILPGIISGTGTFAQNGPGTTIFTGTNTYTGTTTINAGALQLGNGGTTGIVPGDVLNNGNLIFNRSNTYSYDNVVSGTGSVTQAGIGTTVFSKDQTYSGGTTISAGRLQLGSGVGGGTTGSVLGNIANSGILAVNRSDNINFTNLITGPGAFEQNGTGTTTFAVNQAYTGKTTINNGTLQLGSGGTAGSVKGNIDIANASSNLIFNRSDNVVYDGVIARTSLTTGTGSVQQNGTGTTILTGNSTYDGPVNINNGSLQLGNNTASGMIDGSIAINNAASKLIFNRTDAILYSKVISGAGAVEQLGTGTTTLTADNTYAGLTTITNGRLQLGNNGTTGSVTGDIVDNGILAVNRSNTLTFTNRISGSGAFEQNGSGTTIFANDQTYSGGTTINAGTLQLGSGSGGGTAGSVLGNIVNKSALVANRSNDMTIAGVISGSGTLAQIGNGTTILTGNNTYTGTTTITNGTLQLGDGGPTGTVAGDIVNNANLVVNRNNTVTLARAISGSGTFTQAGTGTTIMTADNTYAGTTTITAGRLQIGDGGTTGSFRGGVANSGIFAINRSDTVDFTDLISGSGAFEQNGSGTTLFSGTQAYAGSTTVNAGTLRVDGSIVASSGVSVNNGGTLTGTGSGPSTTVNSGGTLAPGNGLGTYNIQGDLVFNPGSRFLVNIEPPGADLVRVSGTARPRGFLAVIAGPGTYPPGWKYNIITAAGGVTGTFDSWGIINETFLRPILSYDPNNVYLSFEALTICPTDANFTRNQAAVCPPVQALGTGNPIYDAVLILSRAEARKAYDALSGEVHASVLSGLIDDSRYVREAAWRRLRQASYDQATGPTAALGRAGPTVTGTAVGSGQVAPISASDLTVWGQGLGASGQLTGDRPNVSKVDRRLTGLIVGGDMALAGDWRVGSSFNYLESALNLSQRASSAKIQSVHLAAYAGGPLGPFDLRGGFAYGRHWIDTDRRIDFPGFSDKTSAAYQASTMQVFGEIAYGFALDKVALEPFANLAYTKIMSDGFAESGGPAKLKGKSSDQEAVISTVGLRIATSFELPELGILEPQLSLGWMHVEAGAQPMRSMIFQSGNTEFGIVGAPLARDNALIDAGATLTMSETAKIGLTYQGLFATNAADHAIKANVAVAF
jgi:fibronectin-binding autotransporter adhesin